MTLGDVINSYMQTKASFVPPSISRQSDRMRVMCMCLQRKSTYQLQLPVDKAVVNCILRPLYEQTLSPHHHHLISYRKQQHHQLYDQLMLLDPLIRCGQSSNHLPLRTTKTTATIRATTTTTSLLVPCIILPALRYLQSTTRTAAMAMLAALVRRGSMGAVVAMGMVTVPSIGCIVWRMHIMKRNGRVC